MGWIKWQDKTARRWGPERTSCHQTSVQNSYGLLGWDNDRDGRENLIPPCPRPSQVKAFNVAEPDQVCQWQLPGIALIWTLEDKRLNRESDRCQEELTMKFITIWSTSWTKKWYRWRTSQPNYSTRYSPPHGRLHWKVWKTVKTWKWEYYNWPPFTQVWIPNRQVG